MSGMTLVVPMPPNLANRASGRSHWRTIHREKRAYWGTLDLVQGIEPGPRSKGGYYIPNPPEQPFARASIRSTMYLGAAMDDGNAMNRHKWLEDWLVTRGYLVDDRKKCLKWEGFPEQIIKRDGNYRIVLVLTPLTNPESVAA